VGSVDGGAPRGSRGIGGGCGHRFRLVGWSDAAVLLRRQPGLAQLVDLGRLSGSFRGRDGRIGSPPRDPSSAALGRTTPNSVSAEWGQV
jgi:hypothetical protein